MSAGRVLVIEDDDRLSRLLNRALSIRDIEVTVAEDGSLGREAWTAGDFDLVILDVMMPGIDGISLCAERRAAGDETPAILLSARDEDEFHKRGMAAGASAYITKPFAYADLISQVEYLLGG